MKGHSQQSYNSIPFEREDGTPITWAKVKGFDNYMVSDTGLVFSLFKDRIISSFDNGIGYRQIVIKNNEGKAKSMRVHRLVYMAHKGEIPNGLEINHKDECKTNNCIENLELVTRKENNNYGSHNAKISRSMKEYCKQKYA